MLTDGLSMSQKAAVECIEDDIEIIACAGAGKTRVVTRRIINILKSKPEISPENIVAFTFTKKAAEELKSRIYELGQKELGNTTGFAKMYIGTIHGFCLKMLQENIPEYQKYTVLDEIHTKLFVDRYYSESGMEQLNLSIYKETGLFVKVMGVLIENAKDKAKWDENTKSAFDMYCKCFAEHKYFDYSLIMYEMIRELQGNQSFAKKIQKRVKYLTVDEYQDTNPIQEQLISILHQLGANTCVVGDDDQTIYQFRGSSAENILSFKKKYEVSHYISLDTNYRSTQGIVSLAESIISRNGYRLEKEMKSGCATAFETTDIASFVGNGISDEAAFIAQRINELHNIGIPYSEMSILLRKKKIGPDIAEVLEQYDIPFIIEGMNDLFSTPECLAAKGIFDYINEEITMIQLFELWKAIDYPLTDDNIADAINPLLGIAPSSIKHYSEFNLQEIYHNFFTSLSLCEDGRHETEIILYNLGKFSQVINDFETINFTRKPTSKIKAFCSFLKYTAVDYYPEGFLSNSFAKPDAVPIMTIHQAKGLEYSVVFIPYLNKNYFPARKPGGKNIWSVIERSWITNSERFDGTEEDERKLFYVAITRSKKFLFFSRSDDLGNQKESIFWREAISSPIVKRYQHGTVYSSDHLPPIKTETTSLKLNFSLLEDYFECPYRFKLSMFYGFSTPITEEKGYGSVLHSIVDNIHSAILDGEPLNQEIVCKLIDQAFYFPYASPLVTSRLYESVKRNILKYFQHNTDRFKIISASEVEIEIDIGNNTIVNGRIDLVTETNEPNPHITIVDFKSAGKTVQDSINTQQLRIYALGYNELTGKSADEMMIYQLDSERTASVPIVGDTLGKIKDEILDAAENIRNNHLPKKCNKQNCQKCYYRNVCLTQQEQQSL